jgi:hypothetical protein
MFAFPSSVAAFQKSRNVLPSGVFQACTWAAFVFHQSWAVYSPLFFCGFLPP